MHGWQRTKHLSDWQCKPERLRTGHRSKRERFHTIPLQLSEWENSQALVGSGMISFSGDKLHRANITKLKHISTYINIHHHCTTIWSMRLIHQTSSSQANEDQNEEIIATALPWHSLPSLSLSPAISAFEVLVGAAPPLRSGAVQCWQKPGAEHVRTHRGTWSVLLWYALVSFIWKLPLKMTER